MHIKFNLWRWSAWVMALAASFATPLSGAATPPSTVRNIVLVHGAFADGSSWLPVIKILHRKGYHVTAVQNPLSSLADDVAATRRVLERQKGGVILVGHSWAGAVVTEAGNADNVQGLVYLSALVPDSGESVSDMLNRLASPMEGLTPDKEGLIWLDDPVAYRQVMAGDVSVPKARLLAATQQPISARTFADKVTTAAWSKKPSWYLVTENDKALQPNVQRALAQHIGATSMTVKSSHMSLVSHPEVVASLIERAARSVGR
ncbi:alpha/beta fold hydrolase [Undibacterium sp. Di26W]|uniref:alpha/beta fold hydrolase n=1 Tax=Undibacterium sp. Di26W TaxID=3413035 RepID=UPI003BF2F3E2